MHLSQTASELANMATKKQPFLFSFDILLLLTLFRNLKITEKLHAKDDIMVLEYMKKTDGRTFKKRLRAKLAFRT